MPSRLETGPVLMHTAPMSNKSPDIDHCVLAVSDLNIARRRLSALGFTVAPEGQHPFGTSNACIYFQDGSFIEPLAIADAGKYNEAVRKGNVFVGHDWAIRFRRNDEGFSAVALTTENAAADQVRFRAAGISAGPALRFSRAAKDRTGKKDRASFRLAFAADLRSPDVLFFTCERVHVPSIDMTGLRQHANGVIGISAVIGAESEPAKFADFLSCLAGDGQISVFDGCIELPLGKSRISVLDRNRLRREFGVAAGHGRGLRFCAIVFKTADMEQTRLALRAEGIRTRSYGNRIIIETAPGQATTFAFEETV